MARKSKKAGPFQVTVSKSGVSASVGNKWGRVGHYAGKGTQARGRIPGTDVTSTKTLAPANPSAPTQSQRKPDIAKRFGGSPVAIAIGCVLWLVILAAMCAA